MFNGTETAKKSLIKVKRAALSFGQYFGGILGIKDRNKARTPLVDPMLQSCFFQQAESELWILHQQ